MIPNQTEQSYRRIAVQNASPQGLMVILYDLLTADLSRASASMQDSDVESCVHYLKHALLVLQVLEGSLNTERGGELADSLTRFYSHVRARIMEAQFTRDYRILDAQSDLILSVRGAWQQIDSSKLVSAELERAAVPFVDYSQQAYKRTDWTA